MKSPAPLPSGLRPYDGDEEGADVLVVYDGTLRRAKYQATTLGPGGAKAHVKLKSGKRVTIPGSEVYTKKAN